jgi:hypothetical protein
MSKLHSFALFSLLFFGCSTSYNIITNEAHIIIDENNVKHYVNEKLNFSAELSYNDFDYNQQPVVTLREKQILKQVGFDKKNDTILYIGRGSLLVLKNKNIDLTTFRVINLYDSVFMDVPNDEWKINIYRKSVIMPKNKTFIINDLIPFNGQFLQRIEFTETDYNALVDPTNPDDILFMSGVYQEVMRLTKETYLNILQKKIIAPKEVFVLFDEYFKNERTLNYRTAYLAEQKFQNYYKSEEKDFFNQMLATYYAFANNTQKSDSVWSSLTGKNKDDTLQFKIIGIVDDLLKLAENQQVVMFNEAHNSPSHRLLIDNLLESFYNHGFRYLALEAFFADSLFYKTGFPSLDNGFYLCEPNLSNLVRNAYKKGYKIISYDDFYSADRDKAQAENIYNQTIKQDSAAKVLVLAGYGHIDSASMAGKFLQISGIKPFTIDQTVAYLQNLGKIKDNSVEIIERPQKSINTDLYLDNKLIINNINTNTQQISISNSDCVMICIYDENEYNFMLDMNKFPLPIAIYNIENECFVNTNLSKGKYKVLFLDYFGNIIDETNLCIEIE